jgi:hypothetical protein
LGISPFNGQFDFTIETVTTEITPRHLPKFLFIPIQLLPSLRNIMAKMLTDFDGSQLIGPIPPLPKWTQNCIILLKIPFGQFETFFPNIKEFLIGHQIV